MRPDQLAAELTPIQQRRNGLLLATDMALFMAALGLQAPMTLVPLFVSKVTDDPLAIGALSAVFQLGWLPQLLAAGYIERSERKRPWLLIFGFFERLPALGLALCALAATSLSVPLLLTLVYICRFAQALAGGPAATAWLDVVARTVSPRWRGQFMGWSTTVGNLLGVGAAALAVPLLESLGFPLGFAACFGLAFLILVAGFVPLFWVVEPPGPPARPARPFRQQLGELTAVLETDRRFRRFLSGLSLGALGTMGSVFLVVFGVTQLGASDELAAWYTVAMLVGQIVGNPLFGWLADRRGFGVVGQMSALAGVGLAIIPLVLPHPLWLIAAFALLGANQAGSMLARFSGPMEFAPADRLPSYLGLSMGLVSLVAGLAPLLAAPIVGALGYGWLFAASAALSLASAATLQPAGSVRQRRPAEQRV